MEAFLGQFDPLSDSDFVSLYGQEQYSSSLRQPPQFALEPREVRVQEGQEAVFEARILPQVYTQVHSD